MANFDLRCIWDHFSQNSEFQRGFCIELLNDVNKSLMGSSDYWNWPDVMWCESFLNYRDTLWMVFPHKRSLVETNLKAAKFQFLASLSYTGINMTCNWWQNWTTWHKAFFTIMQHLQPVKCASVSYNTDLYDLMETSSDLSDCCHVFCAFIDVCLCLFMCLLCLCVCVF